MRKKLRISNAVRTIIWTRGVAALIGILAVIFATAIFRIPL